MHEAPIVPGHGVKDQPPRFCVFQLISRFPSQARRLDDGASLLGLEKNQDLLQTVFARK